MGKYDPLRERLGGAEGPQIRLSFAEIERVIGADLPKGAREKRGWWADSDEGHAAAWTGAGFSVEEVDMEGERVTYRKNGSGRNGAADAPADDHEAQGRAAEIQQQVQALVESGLDEAGKLMRELAPTLRRYGPYLLLGLAAAAVAGFFLLRSDDEG